MSHKAYWHEKYNLGNEPSQGLMDLLSQFMMPRMEKGLDLGCGKGRNLPVLEKMCNQVVALEANETAFNKVQQDYSDVTAVNDVFQDYAHEHQEEFDIILAWRVLHLGVKEECLENLETVRTMLKPRGLLLIANSARQCKFYEITKNESDSTEIEPGTIYRANSGHDIRHFFTKKEFDNLSGFFPKAVTTFYERKGGNPNKIKTYYGGLFENGREKNKQ